MHKFSNTRISLAGPDDVPAITSLLNGAYRGDSSREGWTTEAHIIAGDVRANEATVLSTLQQPGSVFLKYINQDGRLDGCVNLQQHGNRLYLGMFSVSPKLQGGGIGKKLLQSSEEYAKELSCVSIYMSVISIRTELIAWYQRHGYRDTGNRQVFVEDDISGRHLQELEFMILEKMIG